jgi:hypothetical protein
VEEYHAEKRKEWEMTLQTATIAPVRCPSEFCTGYLVVNSAYINDYGKGELHCNICGKTAAQAKAKEREIKEKLQLQKQKQMGLSKKEMAVTVEVEQVKPARESTWGRSKYLREHIEEIKADMGKMSRKALLKKWGMSSSTIFKFRLEGLLPPATGKYKPKDIKAEKHKSINMSPPAIQRVAEALNNHRLPAFPEFCNTWPGETQVEWLVTYREIYSRS